MSISTGENIRPMRSLRRLQPTSESLDLLTAHMLSSNRGTDCRSQAAGGPQHWSESNPAARPLNHLARPIWISAQVARGLTLLLLFFVRIAAERR